MKEDWKEYVSFTRKERNGVIVLLVLIVLLSVLPYFIPAPDVVVDEATTKEWRSKLAAWKNGKKGQANQVKERNEEVVAAETRSDSGSYAARATEDHIGLFPFDPNHLTESGWKRLGIPDKVIRTIFNYINKGGQFRKPEDIARIYGMRTPDVKRLMPWVKIAEKSGFTEKSRKMDRNATGTFTRPTVADSGNFTRVTLSPVRRKKYIHIDINTADTSAWMNFPGIGSRLAFRIVQYREKLGGFHSPDQVGETWALPDSTFQKIRPWLQCNTGVFRKLSINTAGIEELKQHPYLRWQLANAIVQYRQQHGPFRSAADLQQIILITPLLITRIAPYIEY
ncbi:helix-hairpin-helix domain-containing protein [Pseudobacter ginsenosidimutans]|uniref:DNA uptake protein ComE-like DNA-binding protein n=1 Tax=Pseudobacter ginsenosidimutans TaxID=661488 RepID=A0A4Q7MR18_9BACT|nr:helix-hairpin-helix domain-containing protein [Pseudobacter ginsenosidimutans]QEC41997.1 helix-hairpin-helix domain-containing protein [Pseudobacter ginsenosidimutans]RZS71175.1 DNA uptake protein ComE-like DNA-binding protein [Pseudobacter ginsenosidimutans]